MQVNASNMQAAALKEYFKIFLICLVGKGLNDYDGIFSRLARIGFHGWVSIEDGVNGMEEMKESVRFLRVMREKYF